jgi:hypothetical protein
VAVDILPHIDGIDFDTAWKNRESKVIDQTTGVTAFFISMDDLIAAKLASGRMRDLADVDEIKEAQASRRGQLKPPETETGAGS